jgi:superoxide dismutase, Fe-Mn family
MTYQLPDLPYDPAALEPHLPGRILELHHGKHHAAYVTGLNTTIDKLAEARSTGDYGNIVGLEKNLAFHLSGHVLHSVQWTNLSPDGGGEPDGALGAAIAEHFGSFDAFKKHLSAATVGVQGSGWGALVWEPLGGRLLIEQIYDHQGGTGQSTTPILVIDAWEHAYYLQYLNDRAAYVNAIWNVINWADVAARMVAASS